MVFSSLQLCNSTEDPTTFSFAPPGPCNSPTAIAIPHGKGSGDKPGVLLALYIRLHALLLPPARRLLSHTRHFAAAGLVGFRRASLETHVLFALTFIEVIFLSFENLLGKQATHMSSCCLFEIVRSEQNF